MAIVSISKKLLDFLTISDGSDFDVNATFSGLTLKDWSHSFLRLYSRLEQWECKHLGKKAFASAFEMLALHLQLH